MLPRGRASDTSRSGKEGGDQTHALHGSVLTKCVAYTDLQGQLEDQWLPEAGKRENGEALPMTQGFLSG